MGGTLPAEVKSDVKLNHYRRLAGVVFLSERSIVMSHTTLETAIQEQLVQLSFEQQRQVLEFARALVIARAHGVSGRTLLRFAGLIEADDLVTMQQAIKEDCEQIQPNEW